ncbi:MAG: adenylyl-sulfate kinase [Pirellulaceae bacterium]
MNDDKTSPTIVKWHDASVTRPRGCVVWFTGLSGSGKSTVANRVDALLAEQNVSSFVLDGDNVRHGLNASPEILKANHAPEFAERFGLTFSPMDREENIRRLACVGELFASAGIITLTAFVSPYRRDRNLARSVITAGGHATDFVEVFVDTPLEICEQRDPKGLYKKARAGEIKNFTGISDPYEAPDEPEVHLAGGTQPVDELANQVINYLQSIKKIG